jgi:glycosyltransferase A (GT-A) superfamily protein (DUF2064 family)
LLDQTVARLVESGARLALLSVWYDVDMPGDLQMLAGHIRAFEASGFRTDLEATRAAIG